jgi:SSS family solute:Na+ symporter
MSFSTLDIFVFVLTIVATLGYALWPRAHAIVDAFWVNRRATGTILLTASLSSSIVGAGTIFGVVSMGYKGGIAGAVLGVANAIGVILFGLLVAGRINHYGRVNGWYSIADPLLARYDVSVVRLVGIVNLIAFFFFAAAQFSALSLVLSTVFGLAWEIALVLSTAAVLFYVAWGGLQADIRTDFLQIFFMGFAAALLIISIATLPNFEWNSLAELPSGYFTGFAYAGPEFLIGALLLLPPSVFVSLDIWQRAYAAASPMVARRSFILAGFLMVVFFVAFALVGAMTYVVEPSLTPETAILHAVGLALPVGLGGLVLAGLVAALMSTVDSMLVAASLSLARDAANRIFFDMPHRVALVLGIGAAVTAYAVPDIVQLLLNAFSSLLVLAPLFVGVLGWRRATATAAKASVVTGLGTTGVFLAIDPMIAFIPATMVSAATFVLFSFITKRQET